MNEKDIRPISTVVALLGGILGSAKLIHDASMPMSGLMGFSGVGISAVLAWLAAMLYLFAALPLAIKKVFKTKWDLMEISRTVRRQKGKMKIRMGLHYLLSAPGLTWAGAGYAGSLWIIRFVAL